MERHVIAARRRILDRTRKNRVHIRPHVLSPNAIRLVQGKCHRPILELGRSHMFSAILVIRFTGILHVGILDFYSIRVSAIQFRCSRIVTVLYSQFDIAVNVSHHVRILAIIHIVGNGLVKAVGNLRIGNHIVFGIRINHIYGKDPQSRTPVETPRKEPRINDSQVLYGCRIFGVCNQHTDKADIRSIIYSGHVLVKARN